jgi:hypothetical protein
MREVNLESILDNSRNSVDLIQNRDLKNRRKHKFLPTKIIDNFFDVPSLWRTLALSQEYKLASDSTYPGSRTQFLNQIDQGAFEDFAKRLLVHLPMFKGFEQLWANFHLIDETYGNGWVHDDDPTLSVSGLIYLNPEPAPNSGTTIYKDQIAVDADRYSDFFHKDVLHANEDERAALARYREEQRATFRPTMTIENVYNRCILFDPKVCHAPNNFFGKTKEDSRLTLVFFAKGG